MLQCRTLGRVALGAGNNHDPNFTVDSQMLEGGHIGTIVATHFDDVRGATQRVGNRGQARSLRSMRRGTGR